METTIMVLKSQAEEARKQFKLNAATYGQAVLRRMMYEHQKPVEKDAAIQRLMQGDPTNPMKGITYTAAERNVEAEPKYAAFLLQYREAVRLEALAKGEWEAQKMLHEEAIALLYVCGRDVGFLAAVAS